MLRATALQWRRERPPPERRPSQLPRCPTYPRTPPRLADTSQHHARDKTQQYVRGSRNENQLSLSQKKKKSERHPSQRNQGQDHEPDCHDGVRVPLPRAVYKLRPGFMHMYVAGLDGVEALNEKPWRMREHQGESHHDHE